MGVDEVLGNCNLVFYFYNEEIEVMFGLYLSGELVVEYGWDLDVLILV